MSDDFQSFEPTSKKAWWKFENPLAKIDIHSVIDTMWNGVILGDSKFNPEKSCFDIAEDYRKSGKSVEDCVEDFIRWQTGKAGAVGFLLGAPGFISLAVAIPGDFLACCYLQMRSVAVIALLCGWDVHSDQLKTITLYSMAGESFAAKGSKIAAQAGQKAAGVALKNLPYRALKLINKTLGFRFMTKFGSQGVINLVDFLPVVGGVVSGAVNALMTYTTGTLAFRLLRDGPESEVVIDVEPEENPEVEMI